jgi:hypothetical protein
MSFIMACKPRYVQGKIFDDGNKNSPNNLQHNKQLVNVRILIIKNAFLFYTLINTKNKYKKINIYVQYEMKHITYLSICVIHVFDKLFTTFKFTNNNVAERRFALDPS